MLKAIPTLVRVLSCNIPDHPLINPDDESSQPWTIGRYLKQTFPRRSSIMLGLIFEEVSDMQEASWDKCQSWVSMTHVAK